MTERVEIEIFSSWPPAQQSHTLRNADLPTSPTGSACSMVIHKVENGVYEGPQGPGERYFRVAGEMRGGRTSVYLIHVPPYSSKLHIRLETRQADTCVSTTTTITTTAQHHHMPHLLPYPGVFRI